ncbi:MAG: 3-dehydroquinate synthase [Oscillospiraceae bacterium]|nr:3-dehydroquinate synthase [Oscillospiraceae bacterium]
MIIPVKTSQGSYDIILERGALSKAGEYLNLNRRALIVTDSGVPQEYAKKVAAASKSPTVVTIKEGEGSKQLDTLKVLLETLVNGSFTRTDCVVAVGGGVVGDLAGFAASIFMRGIDFYNIPTTVLSQVDSSIGGKTAIDFMGIKNIVGAFYPPKRVIIDADTLKTLPPRQISNGLCEALKMAVTSDSELFEIFEKGDALSNIDTIIERSLRIKKQVVEEDEREAGLRKILNFGHTLAHAVESANEMQNLYHGECVSLGMLPMCSSEVKGRLQAVLKKLNLPTELSADPETLIEACRHDKKTAGDDITVVLVPEIGSFELKKMPFCELEERIRQVTEK